MFRPDPNTLAGQALATIEAQPSIRALTVEGNYGINGEGARFILKGPPPRVTHQKRNANDRCTAATYQYVDGSVLEFTWSEAQGPRYRQGHPMSPSDAPFERQRRRLRPR